MSDRGKRVEKGKWNEKKKSVLALRLKMKELMTYSWGDVDKTRGTDYGYKKPRKWLFRLEELPLESSIASFSLALKREGSKSLTKVVLLGGLSDAFW